jgi:UrcA family protein
MNRILIPIAALACAATSAMAQTPPSVRVSYAELDLGSDAGVATLDRRIAHAIDRVCPRAAPTDLAAQAAARRCRAELWADIRAQRATALAAARSNRNDLTTASR